MDQSDSQPLDSEAPFFGASGGQASPPPGGAALFGESGVEYVILDRTGDSSLIELLQLQPGWQVDFEDEEALVFTRSM